MGSTPKTNSGRLKLLVEIIAIAEKVSRYLPIIVFVYTGLTLIFAIINILESNIILGIILCFFAGFGLYLTIRIVLTRRRWRRDSRTYAGTPQKWDQFDTFLSFFNTCYSSSNYCNNSRNINGSLSDHECHGGKRWNQPRRNHYYLHTMETAIQRPALVAPEWY
jgi:hypothetical protein